MKVLFYHYMPFALAHGGQQIQIHQTRLALQALGVETEFLRWWDSDQAGDVLHFFGRMPTHLIELAHQKGMKVVVTELLAGQGARPAWRLELQRLVGRGLDRAGCPNLLAALNRGSYRLADACVVVTSWEERLLQKLFDVRPERTHTIPNGVEELFLRSPALSRGPWLVCVATITEIKRQLDLACAAVEAQVPVWFIGRPYTQSDPYAQRVVELTKAHPEFLRYEGPITDRARLAEVYRSARGFVLLSRWESLSLSALEAAACECPMLLSDLPWARTVFGPAAQYGPITASTARTAQCLRRFYEAAPGLKAPPRPLTWLQVGERLKALYESLAPCRTGR